VISGNSGMRTMIPPIAGGCQIQFPVDPDERIQLVKEGRPTAYASARG